MVPTSNNAFRDVAKDPLLTQHNTHQELVSRAVRQQSGFGPPRIHSPSAKKCHPERSSLGPHGRVSVRGVSAAKDLLLFFTLPQFPQDRRTHPLRFFRGKGGETTTHSALCPLLTTAQSPATPAQLQNTAH